MKFNKWVKYDWLDETRININDIDITRIRKGQWEIKFNDDVYKFIASPTHLKDGTYGFMVEWGLVTENGNITTEIVGSKKNVIKIFSKIISCMAIFINEEKPEGFIMYANKRIARIYDAMWRNHHLDEPFKDYFFRDRKEHKKLADESVYVYHYYKKGEGYMNKSQWTEVLDMLK